MEIEGNITPEMCDALNDLIIRTAPAIQQALWVRVRPSFYADHRRRIMTIKKVRRLAPPA